MITISGSTPVVSRNACAMLRACHRASALPLVPIRSAFKASPGPAGTCRESLQNSGVFCAIPECRACARRESRTTRSRSSCSMAANCARSSSERWGIDARRSCTKASRSAASLLRRSPSTAPAATPACQCRNFSTCSSMIDFGARNFGHARLLVLLDNFSQVVNVVEIRVVEIPDIRGNVARELPGQSRAGRDCRAPPWHAR